MLFQHRRHAGRATHLIASLALVATALGAGATSSSAAPVAGAAAAPTGGDRVDVRLEPVPGSPVSDATVSLSPPAMRTAATRRVRTPRLTTSTFEMVGLTWRGARDPGLSVRTLREDGWSSWTHLHPLTDRPNAQTAEGRRSVTTRATGLLWVGESRGVQVTSHGAQPRDLDLVLIDPGSAPAPSRATKPRSTTAPTARRKRPEYSPKPAIRGRKAWNPNPKWRNGEPVYMKKLKAIHVHHTATGNSYSRSDVPGIIRGMYSYHTRTLGWFDIGYNFLVDRFGRGWVGRSGGPRSLVRGAHTLGFNQRSVGIAMIGNYVGKRPSRAAVTKVMKIAAWKLDKHGRKATGKVGMVSQGSDKFPPGQHVRIHAIDGHRDTNDTACPGGKLYNKLPSIRKRAQRRVENWNPPKD